MHHGSGDRGKSLHRSKLSERNPCWIPNMLEGGPVRPQEDGSARQRQPGASGRPRDGSGSKLLERKTTLAAIAAAAGVSLPTVSKVVNGRPDVAAETRARGERRLGEHN